MRRHDREITDRTAMLEVIRQCDVCRIALNDDGYPYILPLNFGWEEKDGTLLLYFHGANEGTKYDLMAKDNRASFEMDCKHRLEGDLAKGMCTMHYESVIGCGRMTEITDEAAKIHALEVLCRQYYKDGFPFDKGALPMTRVLQLTVEKMTGKRR